MTRFRTFLLTAGGLGHAPVASGTFGSLPPVAIALLMAFLGQPVWLITLVMLLLVAVFSVACVRFGGEAEALFGRKDPGQVVADEVAGQALALSFLPWADPSISGAAWQNLLLGVGAFLAFRFFDILKPPPASSLESLKGGLGILVDDLITGLMALVVVQVVARGLLGWQSIPMG
ncbi:MAG: phosphatidylglycerophosphatase A [Planctomycetota bacterium]|nr:phosphatidylglycerophosphatase A [Planctomycetota bacterium]MEC8560359.1 phosphatidylglycerophosphatase A [Planctomycetota bacterium]MEC9157516.1 phosphatidylglycerophosphatase A [Planctomycetota bacterium]MEC9234313.1 phosphatidylglycerophosphatase A [Planctomycetota bacterium]